MRNRMLWASLAVLVFAGAAMAGKGGDIPFNHDPQKAMKMARSQGLGMMLYFTSEG